MDDGRAQQQQQVLAVNRKINVTSCDISFVLVVQRPRPPTVLLSVWGRCAVHSFRIVAVVRDFKHPADTDAAAAAAASVSVVKRAMM